MNACNCMMHDSNDECVIEPCYKHEVMKKRNSIKGLYFLFYNKGRIFLIRKLDLNLNNLTPSDKTSYCQLENEKV